MRLGIDFGTTNSSVARFDGDRLDRVELDPTNENSNVLPSLIYINRQHNAEVGTAAATQYLKQETGRAVSWEQRRVGEIDVTAADMSYVQSVHVMVDIAAQGRLLQYVKTALRDPSYDGTQIFDRFYTVDELISIILRRLKTKAKEQFQAESRQVVIGRPVRFSNDARVTARAEEILFKAARLAGFEDIRFEMEPVGAAYYFHRTARQRQTAFIFDFGGGTLDLTVAQLGGKQSPRILATTGVLVGGDDLDRRIMQSLRKFFGAESLNGRDLLPPHIFDLLDNWQTMPLLSRPNYLRLIDEFKKAGNVPKGIAALRTLVTKNLGFSLFREIEQAKKDLSWNPDARLNFEHENIDLREGITREQFEMMIRREIDEVERGIQNALAEAGIKPSDIDIVLRTGGTSAVPVFTSLLARIFGEEKLVAMDLLTSVVGGLAVVAHEGGGTKPRFAARYNIEKNQLITDIRAKSGREYGLCVARVGANCYADNPYTIARMPVELSGLPGIKMAQADKNDSSGEFLEFNLARVAEIFIAYDAEARKLPDWLGSFTARNQFVMIDQHGTERMLRLYSKEFSAGKVRIGGNRAAGQSGDIFMNYSVIVRVV